MSKLVYEFMGDIEAESMRRQEGITKPDIEAYTMWNNAVDTILEQSARQVHMEAHQFAKSVKYQHVGLSPELYFPHPLRVGAMSIYVSDTTNQEVGIVGILHNILEVSEVSCAELQQQFGKSVADQIITLTVDRKQEWDSVYKSSYYQKINQGPCSAKIVKIMDKLDNIFLINNNPDFQIRKKYLEEIERHVLPMARRELPNVAEYMSNVIEYNYNLVQN